MTKVTIKDKDKESLIEENKRLRAKIIDLESEIYHLNNSYERLYERHNVRWPGEGYHG